MTVSAFRKFDVRAFLESERKNREPAKVAKVAKAADASAALCNPARHSSGGGGLEVNEPQSQTLATLATLAAERPADANCASPPTIGSGENYKAAIDETAPQTWVYALARLDPEKPPADVPASRWGRFIQDGRRFIDDGWGDQAVAQGWSLLDLFGCNRNRPFARIDHLGLIWLINGGRVVDLHSDAAVIMTKQGSRLSYRRSKQEAEWLANPLIDELPPPEWDSIGDDVSAEVNQLSQQDDTFVAPIADPVAAMR